MTHQLHEASVMLLHLDRSAESGVHGWMLDGLGIIDRFPTPTLSILLKTIQPSWPLRAT